jgi:hypothetical protein
MSCRSMHMRLLVFVLSVSVLFMTAPFTLAETIAAPLGTIVANGIVTVGDAAAPTGTTIFTGDQLTSNEPALINLASGSRVEMTKAAARFARQGNTLVLNADQGLLRFSFIKGEDVQINAGKFRFTGGKDTSRSGELGLNRNGEIVMNLTEGSFIALNAVTGIRTLVSPASPMAVVNPASVPPRGMSKAKIILIIAGVAGAVVGGILYQRSQKSKSSR